MLTTPYYRTLAPTNKLGCDDEPDFNYGPYDIFCMESRLYPIVSSLFNDDVDLVFKTINGNNRMDLVVTVPSVDNIEFLQDQLDKIITTDPGYCLIDQNELYLSSSRKYPRDWFNLMLSYVPVPTEYNPYVRSNGIYISFNPLSDFNTAYNDVCTDILKTLDRYYKEGVVFGAADISVPWKLERLDMDEVVPKLYKPLWSDKRFAPHIVEFLMGKIQNDPYIYIDVSDNLVVRFNIALALSRENIRMIFDGSRVKIPVSNLDDAQYITSLVKSSEKTASGKVITYGINKLSLVHLYIDAANDLLSNPGCTGYQVTDPYNPYVFSCLIGPELSTTRFLNKLHEIVWKMLSIKK